MPTNALLKTNTSGTWNSSTGFSYSTIPTITGIAHKDQIEVERKFTVPSGTVLVQEDFRKIFVIASNNYTLDEANKKITAFSASFPNYVTKAGVSITVPAVSNGDSITIRRKSISSESLVTWLDGTRLTASQLNLQTSQLVNLAQEILDRLNYEFVTATDLEYNSTYSTATRTWVEGRLGALPSGQSAKTYIDAADTNIQSQVDSAVAINTTQNGRLDAIETLNTSQTASINALTPRVSPSTSLTGTYSASNLSAAVNGLDTRVTATESTNTSQGSAITALQTKVGAGTITGTIVANGSDIVTAVNAIDDYVTSAVTTSSNTIFNGHAQGRIVYAGANGTKDSTANFTITPSSTSPTVLTLAGNLSQTGNQNITGNLTQAGVLNLTGNTTSVLNLTGTFTVNADSATVPTFKGASTQKIVAFKNSSNVEVNAIDQYGNLTGRATATYGSSSPTNPLAGTIWYDSANTAFKIYNGSAWTQISTTTLANYVGLSGNETVAGNKTFSGAMTLSSGLTVDTNALVVNATNDRVGIGTASPGYKLTLTSSPSAGTPQGVGTDGNVIQTFSYQTTGNIAYSGTLSDHPYGLITNNLGRLFITNAGNVGIGTVNPSSRLHVHENASSLGVIQLTTTDTGTTSTNGLALGVSSTATSLWNYENLPLVLGTNATERLRITNEGNVGIGTSSPTGKLHVVGNTKVTSGTAGGIQSDITNMSGIHLDGGISASSTSSILYSSGGGGGAAMSFLRNDAYLTGIALSTNNASSANTTTERMRIDWNGNVGIGTTAPVAKLQVANLSPQYSPQIGTRQPGNQYEFGHSNAAGYGSVIGAEVQSGAPFIAFNCGAGTNNNTYKTLGLAGAVLKSDNAGGLNISTIAGVNADNQSVPTDPTIAFTPTSTVVIGSSTKVNNASFLNGLKLEIITASTDCAVGLYHYGDSDAGNAIRSFRAKGSKASPTAVVSGNILGSIRGLGYNGSAFTAQTGGMDIVTTENWTAGANGTAIAFNTTPNGSGAASMTERMRIDSSGALIHNKTTSGATGAISLVPSGASPTLNRLVFGTDGTGYKFAIASKQGSNASVDRLLIEDNGQVEMPANISASSTTTGTLVVTGGVGVGENLYAAGKIVAPTVKTDLIISDGPIRIIGNSDRFGVITPTLSDVVIGNDGVTTFSQPPKYTTRPLLYAETSVSADVASATSGFRFGTGFTSYSSTSYPVKYTKIGPLVILQGLISAATTNTALGNTIALLKGLPAPANPTIHTANGIVNFGGAANNYKATLRGDITTGGDFVISYFVGDGQNNVTNVPSLNTSATNWISVSLVYMADAV